MKKLIGILLVVVMLTVACFAADITVTLNGETVDCESYGSPATIVEGRTLVPLRAIFEALGASVEWDQATRTVSSTLGEDSISLAVGSTKLIKNGEDVTLDVPAQIINDRTMVPARAIAEAYGVGVEWDAATRTVILTQVVAEEDVVEDTFMLYSQAYATGCDSLQVVADPVDASNEVYYMQSNKGDQQSWTYFWIPATFKPSERYIVNFDVYLDTDALGGEIVAKEPSIGICFSYGDYAESADGKATHHGNTIDNKGGRLDVPVQEWVHGTYIYEMPETLNENEKMVFGIFGNPVDVPGMANQLSVNFYLDNVTVEVYEGVAENGLQTDESIKAAEDKASFDFDTTAGAAFDLDADTGDFLVSATYHEYVDGHLVVTAEGENADPTISFTNSGIFTAEKYNAVAVRFKAEGVDENQRHIVVYFATTADDSLSQSKSITVKYDDLDVDEDGYYVAYIIMSANPAWKGQIAALRVDPGNSKGIYTIDKIVVVEK